jgi:lipoprotein-anchoring transpeptidase ErfK/SrfK
VRLRILHLAFIFCLCFSVYVKAQNKNYEDTGTSQDSLKIYKKIHRLASKRKLTYLAYKAIFVEPKTTVNTPVAVIKAKSKEQQKDPIARYKGKIIKNIELIRLDPFGTDINNIEAEQANIFLKAGNRVHIKTRRYALRSQLLFKEGDVLDPISLKETERIIRQSGYIKDAKILVNPIKGVKDTVNVVVITQDVWSINGNAAVSTSFLRVRLVDKNFVGSGQQIENSLNYNFDGNPKIDLVGSYNVPNIRKTFISGNVFYKINALSHYEGLSFNRQFYTAVTKWAGGITLFRSNSTLFYNVTEPNAQTLPLTYNSQDVWLGRSFQITPGKSDEDRSSRLVLTSRVYRFHYTERPGLDLDPLRVYHNSTLYLGSIGYSNRLYYKDKDIFRFGYTEDVPQGRLVAYIGGKENLELYTRYYSGVKFAAGEHLTNLGYIAAGAEYGTFFRENRVEKSVLNGDMTYFTDLEKYGKWAMRQFVYTRFAYGAARDKNERININNELYGFRSDPVSGTSKIVVNLQNVVYTPINFIGFQFAVVAFAGFGMLGDDNRALLKSQVYQAYGLGLLVRNENLVVNTFELSFGFYPNLAGDNDYRVNPISNYNLRFKDYFLSKPELISYY